ncbi:hypothetical protein PCASD_01450 [Puccinia coronata f. sp. avenae]|uniref:Uncharacterized protein n=1 Tax=Puccinia coronata f. sp. avenae TaxID=200324 RepID=A0A2N5VKP6_9BASI|nr:hypothetical protein PCASD_01450 [Puccinia coronata f. sp. avenae]
MTNAKASKTQKEKEAEAAILDQKRQATINMLEQKKRQNTRLTQNSNPEPTQQGGSGIQDASGQTSKEEPPLLDIIGNLGDIQGKNL